MLVCGQVNPPPMKHGYAGVYFGENDNMSEKAQTLKGIPLRVEHNTQVGNVITGWVSSDGALWALAEIDTSRLPGAFTASAVEKGKFKEFSLGYRTKMKKDPKSGKIVVGKKDILEVSIVRKGARENCKIQASEKC